MSTTINWKELDDKEKTRLILEHVMGCTESDSLYALDVEKYPVAVYVDHLKIWFLELEEEDRPIAKGFDPLHDLNDAWLIVDRYDVIDLLRIKKSNYRVQLCKGNISTQGIAATAQEAICIAALKAVGCEVQL